MVFYHQRSTWTISNLNIYCISVGEPELGDGAVKPYLVGSGAGTGKNILKTAQEPEVFLEPEPVKDILKEPKARPLLEGAGAESR